MTRQRQPRGVAIVIVLWVIMVLSLLISGFAFTMHVETQVASFGRKELKAEMLARSGVEVARMQLILDQNSSTDGGFDALNQAWATNQDLYVEHELAEGKFNVIVTDEEKKLPINQLEKDQLQKLMEVLGVDPLDGDVIVDSIIDWIDENDLHQLNGAENDYYQQLSPPYQCKDGKLDRIEELLLVRGVTRELFDGVPATDDEPGRPGLKELLTTSSQGQVNINTASGPVLQVLFGIDDTRIEAVVARRDGQDGVPGTEDDQPFRTVGEVFQILGVSEPKAQQVLSRRVKVSSEFFNVKSTGDVNGVKYTIDAVLRRQGGDCVVTSWTEKRGS